MFQLLCEISSHVQSYLYMHIVNYPCSVQIFSTIPACVDVVVVHEDSLVQLPFPVFVGRYRSVSENNVIVVYPSSAYCDVCKIETIVINL